MTRAFTRGAGVSCEHEGCRGRAFALVSVAWPGLAVQSKWLCAAHQSASRRRGARVTLIRKWMATDKGEWTEGKS